VKKKILVSDKDKKDWLHYTKNLEGIYNKDLDTLSKNKQINSTKKIDLHGLSLERANAKVENFIKNCFKLGYRKLIIITGKGSRSKVYNDPYKSEKMSVLKFSVPDFIKNNPSLTNKINKITKANQKDGGDGAFYIFLKNNVGIKE
tara:strand:- start:452 stop:889 length:438 start_codon:yes stop_codon:yes gene_type:complete